MPVINLRSSGEVRWAFASGQSWAKEKAHKTKGGKGVRYRRLPASKHSGKKGGPGALGPGGWSKKKKKSTRRGRRKR